MATDKQYTVVGIAKYEGEYKMRFTNNVMRIKFLHNKGCEDVRLVELDEPMCKYDAVCAIQDLDAFQDDVARNCISDYLSTHDKPKAKVEKELEMA